MPSESHRNSISCSQKKYPDQLLPYPRTETESLPDRNDIVSQNRNRLHQESLLNSNALAHPRKWIAWREGSGNDTVANKGFVITACVTGSRSSKFLSATSSFFQIKKVTFRLYALICLFWLLRVHMQWLTKLQRQRKKLGIFNTALFTDEEHYGGPIFIPFLWTKREEWVLSEEEKNNIFNFLFIFGLETLL